MYELSLAVFGVLAAITVWNTVWTVVMARVLRNRRTAPVLTDEELPKAAILLCLRGADPNLSAALRRLMSQDYPRYELFVAVDSEADPAWQVVQGTIQELKATNVHVAPLRTRLATCSLKCSSLVQLVDELDRSHEVIVLADADLESHPTWLRELVAPLADPTVGATFGNRWFLPTTGWLGSLVRQVWNAPGLVAMHVIQIPWAGSLAIRSEVFWRGGLREKWSHSIVDDGPLRTAVKKQGLTLRFVPSVIMANREECSLRYAYNFLRRQMTWTRTYMPIWWTALLAYSYLSIASWTVAAILAVGAFCCGPLEAAWWLGSGAGLLGAATFLSWLTLDICARRVIREQGEPAPSVWSRELARLPIAMSLAAWMHLVAAVAATVRRRIMWRGVTYEILGPSHIRIVHERAFIAFPAATNSPATAVSI